MIITSNIILIFTAYESWCRLVLGGKITYLYCHCRNRDSAANKKLCVVVYRGPHLLRPKLRLQPHVRCIVKYSGLTCYPWL